MDDIDTAEYVRRISELNQIKDRYQFTTSVKPRLEEDVFLWDFIRDDQYSNGKEKNVLNEIIKTLTLPFSLEFNTLLQIMEVEESWQKLRYSKILVQNKIINSKSAEVSVKNNEKVFN